MKRLQNLNHADIVAYFNAVVRGITNYYTFADNRSSLGALVRILHMSCARTMALKYKLRFMAKAYKNYGKLLTCPETGVCLYKPNTLTRVRTFNTKEKPATLEILEKSWANKLTRSNLGHTCIVCGAPHVQIHHVRKVRELK